MTMDNPVSQAKSSFITRAADAVGHFALEAGETAFKSGIEDPINALDQLVNHAVLKPLTGYELPKLDFIAAPEVHGTSDKVAKVVGTMAGKIADMIVVGKVLKATGVMQSASDLASSAGDLPVISSLVAPIEESATLSKLAGAFGHGALLGGIVGFGLQPAPDNAKNFWRDRMVNGLSWSASMAVGSTMGEGISLGLAKEGLDPESSAAAKIGARVIKTGLRQGTNRIINVRSAIQNLFGEEPLVATVRSK
jgi:hypothetical protein